MSQYEIYFADSGVPTSGLSVTWESLYQRDGGGAIPVSAQPSFSDLGNGWYTFSYSPTETVLGTIDGSSALGDTDRYVPCKFTIDDNAVQESRLVELDSVNIPSDIDFIYADVSGLNGESMRGTDGALTSNNVNITHINNDPISATDSATLNLKALNITNTTGNAVSVQSTAGNYNGVLIIGSGQAAGLRVKSGTDGEAAAVYLESVSDTGPAIMATSDNGVGILAKSWGTSAAVKFESDSGTGFEIIGGNGIDIDANEINNIYTEVSGLNGEAMRGTDNAITDISILATSAAIVALNDLSVNDLYTLLGLNTSATIDELASIPVNPTVAQALMLSFLQRANKQVSNSSTGKVETYNAAGTKLFDADITDDGSIFTKDKLS